MKGYPSWFSRNLILSCFTVLFLTGLSLAPSVFSHRLDYEVPWTPEANTRILLAATHLLSAIVVCLFVGALLAIHVRQEWGKKKNRSSGIGILSSLAYLTITGIGLYYLGNKSFILFSSLSHLIIGIFIFVATIWHTLKYVKSKSKRNSK